MTNIIADSIFWYIAHNTVDIFHYGVVEVGQQITSSQPEFEQFTNEEDYLTRINELNIIIEE